MYTRRKRVQSVQVGIVRIEKKEKEKKKPRILYPTRAAVCLDGAHYIFKIMGKINKKTKRKICINVQCSYMIRIYTPEEEKKTNEYILYNISLLKNNIAVLIHIYIIYTHTR